MKEESGGLRACMYRKQVGQKAAQNLSFPVAQVAVCVQRIVLAIETQSHAGPQVLHFLLAEKRDLSGRSTQVQRTNSRPAWVQPPPYKVILMEKPNEQPAWTTRGHCLHIGQTWKKTILKIRDLDEVFQQVVDSDPSVCSLLLPAQDLHSLEFERKGFDCLFHFLKNLYRFLRTGDSKSNKRKKKEKKIIKTSLYCFQKVKQHGCQSYSLQEPHACCSSQVHRCEVMPRLRNVHRGLFETCFQTPACSSLLTSIARNASSCSTNQSRK